MNKLVKAFLAGVLLAGLAGAATARAAENDTNPGPSFQEVYDLVRTHAPGVNPAALNRAAVEGLLSRFASLAFLETNVPAADHERGGSLLSQTTVFDGAYGYLRVSRVAAGLADEMASAFARLSTTNKLKGLVLDLRFARGDDYAAAAAAADKFLTGNQPLLICGDQTVRSTTKSSAIAPPLMILVNHETEGAAEALAGVLRHAEAGLLIGARTAGRAYVFQEFPLQDGERLRVATTMVKLGNGQAFPVDGLTPDIQVAVKADDERVYFADAYKVLTNQTPVLFASTVTTNSSGATNSEPVHRLNEAELVRRQKEGQSVEDAPEAVAGRSAEAAKPVVQDPALGRALDLLKGLAVVQQQMRQP